MNLTWLGGLKLRPMIIKDGFEAYLKYLIQVGKDPKTIREHRRYLYGAVEHSILTNKNVENITLTDLSSLIQSGRTHGEYGPQRAMSVFRCYLRFLKESGIKLPFDYRDIELPRVPFKQQPFFEEEELFKFLDSFELNHPKTPVRRMEWTMKVLYETLFSTGMRISEALSLRRDQFKEIKEKKEAVIKDAKSKDEGKVFFTERCIMWLEKYLEQRTDTNQAMFVNSFGEPLLAVTAKSHRLRFRDKYGEVGKKLKFHTFRRTLSNMLIEKGVDIKSTQTIMRHRSERTTLRHYARHNPKRAKEVYLALVDKPIQSLVH